MYRVQVFYSKDCYYPEQKWATQVPQIHLKLLLLLESFNNSFQLNLRILYHYIKYRTVFFANLLNIVSIVNSTVNVMVNLKVNLIKNKINLL